MLTREITYYNLDEELVTKKFNFNMTPAELLELEASFEGGLGLVASIQRIAEANDSDKMMKEFKRIIFMTYGVRNGDDFDKSLELCKKFESTGAYSALLMEFLQDDQALVKFIEGVMPKHMPKPKDNVVAMPPPPSPMEVARVTQQQRDIGAQIVNEAGM
jgi:hypothetical protein